MTSKPYSLSYFKHSLEHFKTFTLKVYYNMISIFLLILLLLYCAVFSNDICGFHKVHFFTHFYKIREESGSGRRNLFLLVFLRNLNISRKNYINGTSRLRASKLYIICSYFKSLKFFWTPIPESLGSHFTKSKYF